MRGGLRIKLTAECLGTAFLVAAVVGSGIMGERLAGGNVAIALLANTIATGAALVALILTFGPISGAHLNPAVSFADALEGGLTWREAGLYAVAQCAGGLAGVVVAHLMFGLPWLSLSTHVRHGWRQGLSEFVATFGLVAVIWGCSRRRSGAVPFAVAGYIVAAYWFTASTSFANPAVTWARCFSDTFSGIRLADAPWFVAAQFGGAWCATLLFRWMAPGIARSADSVVMAHARMSGVKSL
jgi:glycerol uptake facilitator-like aquaporin